MDVRKFVKRKDKKHYTTNHEKVSDIDGKIKLKVKDIDEDETESDVSNKADIDEFDAPKNQSIEEESQCCIM